jgi:hypothetical protein
MRSVKARDPFSSLRLLALSKIFISKRKLNIFESNKKDNVSSCHRIVFRDRKAATRCRMVEISEASRRDGMIVKT